MKKTILAIALSLVTTSAMALDLNLTAGIGHAKIAGDSSTAAKIAVSHNYGKNLSAEISYLRGGNYAGVTTGAVDVAAIGRYALTDSFLVTGRLGVSRTFARDAGETDAHVGATYGVGASYQFNANLAANVTLDQYRNFADSDEHMNVTMIGATYKF